MKARVTSPRTWVGPTEQRPMEAALLSLSCDELNAKVLLDRLTRIARLPAHASILDIGAAQGLFLIGCAKLGHKAVGLEPWFEARETALAIADHVGVHIELHDGMAEALPFADESFDIVRASSVIEHVDNVANALSEAYRVLRPSGVLWFLTASSLCPRQAEIRGFPMFGWYPGFLKLRVMNWALAHKPHLIGHTTRPAYHWFTPRKTRRMLREAGFTKVYDRWDLRLPSEGGRIYRTALSVIRLNAVTKFCADVCVPCCSYAAVKLPM